MISPWIKCYNTFSLKNKMEVSHPIKLMKKDELIYYDKNDNSNPSFTTDLVGCCDLMSYKDTIYLGIIPIDEVLLKTGYGHFYLYHSYNKNIIDINELEISLKLFAVVKTTPHVGLHIPIVKKAAYTTNSSSIKIYYALGSFDDNKKKFQNIEMLIDYYKKISPSQIINENRKLLKSGKIVETNMNTFNLSKKPSSITDASLISVIKNQSFKENDQKYGCKKNMKKKICNDKDRSKKSCYNESLNNSQKKKRQSTIKNKKLLEDELKSLSIVGSTTQKSSEPSTTLIENFNIQKKKICKKLIRNDDFYNNYYLGEVTRKEAKKTLKNSFEFVFYHRVSKKNLKKRKKIMYLIYKPIKGKPIHLPVSRIRNPKYDGSKGSVKRFYVVKTPYNTKDQFNNFKEMVDHYYNRIEKVKQLYQHFIK